MDKVEYIVEFQSNTSGKGMENEPEMDRHSALTGTRPNDLAASGSTVDAWDKTTRKGLTAQIPAIGQASKNLDAHGSSSLKLSLAEKLKQRMRQGLDQSGK